MIYPPPSNPYKRVLHRFLSMILGKIVNTFFKKHNPTARDRSSRRSEAKSSRANSIAVATDASSADFRPVITSPAQRARAQFGDQPLASQDAEVDEVVDEDADSETDYVPDSRNSVERTSQQRPLMLSSSSGDKGIKQSLEFRFIQKLVAFNYPTYDKMALP